MATDFANDAPVGLSGLGADAGKGVGAMLKRRRIELEMSQADVASALKVVVRRIDAMETERWDELPTGPFLRGFVRNYARALNIDAAALTERIDASLLGSRNPDSILMMPETLKPLLPRRSGPAEAHHTGRSLIYGAFVFALLAALIAWSGTNSFARAADALHEWVARETGMASSPPAAATKLPQTVSRPPATSGAADTRRESLERTAPGAEVAPPSRGKEWLASTGAAADVAAGHAPAALTLHFDDVSWVEVSTADGNILLSRLNPVGSEQTVTGPAPFELIIGNAPGVVLDYQGQVVDLAPYTRERVARLTLS